MTKKAPTAGSGRWGLLSVTQKLLLTVVLPSIAVVAIPFVVTVGYVHLGAAWDLLSGHTSASDAPGRGAAVLWGRITSVVGYFLLPTLVGTAAGVFVSHLTARYRRG